jgi:hypothetical protein
LSTPALYAKQCSLRLVKPPTDFPPLSKCMQWHPLEDLDPELAWFRKYVRGAAKTFELNSAVGAMVQGKDCGSFDHRSLGMANIRRIHPA